MADLEAVLADVSDADDDVHQFEIAPSGALFVTIMHKNGCRKATFV